MQVPNPHTRLAPFSLQTTNIFKPPLPSNLQFQPTLQPLPAIQILAIGYDDFLASALESLRPAHKVTVTIIDGLTDALAQLEDGAVDVVLLNVNKLGYATYDICTQLRAKAPLPTDN